MLIHCTVIISAVLSLHQISLKTAFDRHELIANLNHMSYNTSVTWIPPEYFTCPLGKLRTDFSSPIANPWVQAKGHDFLCTMGAVNRERISTVPSNGLEESKQVP